MPKIFAECCEMVSPRGMLKMNLAHEFMAMRSRLMSPMADFENIKSGFRNNGTAKATTSFIQTSAGEIRRLPQAS
jgi:hypothetical protein